ncbi:MAG: hypothetical protein EPN93_18980 [Spirochaetes bacterium]|nr:MAG: hypothetical protein EPN93_18980 [Spirochaetota bacterium]
MISRTDKPAASCGTRSLAPAARVVAACALILSIFIMSAVNANAQVAAPGGEKKPSIEGLEYDSILFSKKLDPIFAGMLSWYMPGLGQYYSAEYTKGTIFLVTEYTLVFGAIFYYLNIDFAAGTGSGFNLRVDAKRTDLGVVETSRRNVFFGLIGIAVGLHLYNMYDAVMSARGYNTRLEKSRIQYREIYPKLDFGSDGKSLFLGVERAL